MVLPIVSGRLAHTQVRSERASVAGRGNKHVVYFDTTVLTEERNFFRVPVEGKPVLQATVCPCTVKGEFERR